MKIKVGDIVKTDKGNGKIIHIKCTGRFWYLVKIEGLEGHGGDGFDYINEDGVGDKWWFNEKELELIQQDLRDLLQVGYKVEYKTCNPHKMATEIRKEEYLALIKKYVNQDLVDSGDDTFTINAIYKPKYNGLKPMEWELIWEREEELFTLELSTQFMVRNILTYHKRLNKFDFKKIKNHDTESLQQRFTQQEIDNLPNQELIKALVKKPVKGN